MAVKECRGKGGEDSDKRGKEWHCVTGIITEEIIF